MTKTKTRTETRRATGSGHAFPYEWSMSAGYPAPGVERHGSRVFSTFACGGGSTMGYKLAGYDVVGANDIDPEMERVYRANHKPGVFLRASIRDLVEGPLPPVLEDLDVLDGSPPCSTFSLAGDREGAWGVEKKFREGQAVQVLDDLFFDFIALADRLRPKVVIGENVKGMLQGNAKGYVLMVMDALAAAGYDAQLFLLNAARMGVPQKRERVFFVARRRDLGMPPVRLDFAEEPVTLGEAASRCRETKGAELTPSFRVYWNRMGVDFGSFSRHHPKGSYFNTRKCDPRHVMCTIAATSAAKVTHWESPHELSSELVTLCGSFPRDYDYLDLDPKYLVGMSVPPVMMAQVALRVYQQCLAAGRQGVVQ